METQFTKTFTKVLLLACVATITIDAMQKELNLPRLTFTITNQDTEDHSCFIIEYPEKKGKPAKREFIKQNKKIIITPDQQYWDFDKKTCNPYFIIWLNNSYNTYMNSLVFDYSSSNALLTISDLPANDRSKEIKETIKDNLPCIMPLAIIDSRLQKLKNESLSEN
jgi:hypothetical protein